MRFGLPLILICYAFAWGILGVFIVDPHALRMAHESLMVMLWSIAVYGNTAVLTGVMRGSGTVLWPTIISIFAIWGLEVPAAYLFDASVRARRRCGWAVPPGFAAHWRFNTPITNSSGNESNTNVWCGILHSTLEERELRVLLQVLGVDPERAQARYAKSRQPWLSSTFPGCANSR